MSKKNDGGSAFPMIGEGPEDKFPIENHGMSLRDYFAGQAMIGIMHAGGWGDFCTLAKKSYEIADSMLEARDK